MKHIIQYYDLIITNSAQDAILILNYSTCMFEYRKKSFSMFFYHVLTQLQKDSTAANSIDSCPVEIIITKQI